MISRISGELVSVSPGRVLLSVGGGLVYELLTPAYLTARLLPRLGEHITLATFHYLEGQGQGSSFLPRLLGFTTDAEREFFELFTTVNGIGYRKGLRALAQEPARVAALIAARDAAGLRQLPEIGPKLAEMIVTELKDKVTPFLAAGVEVKPVRLTPAGDEAVAALIALGEPRPEAERRVARALERRPSADSVEAILAAVYGSA